MDRRSRPRDPRPLALLALCAIVAIAGQALLIPVDADVSWLITVSERVLGGARLYVDIFEVNPPASVWLYLPQVALAQALGLRAEAVVVAIAVALALAAAALTLRLAQRLADPPPPLVLAVALGFALLVLPGGLFAQREHYALVLAVPLCAWLAGLEAKAGSRSAFAGGLAGGVLVAIKPHFALALAAPALWTARRRGTWRPLALAALAALAVLGVYAFSVWRIAPAYADRLDMLAELYLPMRERWVRLLYGPVVLFPAALALLLAWLGGRRPARLSAMLGLAALGFTLAALIQGKGYWNHALPAVGLMIVAVAVQAYAPARPRDRRPLALAALAALGLAGLTVTARIGPPRGLVDEIRRVGPPEPTIVTLGTELATGHPAVRLVGGSWAGSRAALFTAAGVRYRTRGQAPADPRLQRWLREDFDVLARDIAVRRPDLVLVERDDKGWALRDPAIAAAMQSYRPGARSGDIEIWLRRPAPGLADGSATRQGTGQ